MLFHSRDPLANGTIRTDEHRGRDDRDPVLEGEVRLLRDIDGEDRATVSAKRLLQLAAIGAEGMRELHNDLSVDDGAELHQIDVVDDLRAHAASSRREPVHLATDAKTRGRSEDRECRDDATEDLPGGRETGRVREARRTQERDADHVREPRWPRVLDRSLTETRLDDLEVQEAREAVPATEGQADGKLERDGGKDPHQPVNRASSDSVPTMAWFVRGARASMTEVSRYGCAVRMTAARLLMR